MTVKNISIITLTSLHTGRKQNMQLKSAKAEKQNLTHFPITKKKRIT